MTPDDDCSEPITVELTLDGHWAVMARAINWQNEDGQIPVKEGVKNGAENLIKEWISNNVPK